jgi:hypothetical protein
VVLEVAVELLEVGLDSLDLGQGGVAQLGDKAEAFVDGSEGLIVLVDLGFEDLVLLVSDVGLVGEGFPVLVDVGSQLSQGVGQSVPGGEENVVDHVVSVEDVSVGILDLLGQPSDVAVVVVGSSVEIVDQLAQLILEISNQFLDGLDQLLEVALGLQVQLGVVQNEAGPVGGLNLSQNLLFSSGPSGVLDVH